MTIIYLNLTWKTTKRKIIYLLEFFILICTDYFYFATFYYPQLTKYGADIHFAVGVEA